MHRVTTARCKVFFRELLKLDNVKCLTFQKVKNCPKGPGQTDILRSREREAYVPMRAVEGLLCGFDGRLRRLACSKPGRLLRDINQDT